ncbi:MAG: aminopeptidase P family protein [Planctomycetaceae bacterium]|nr:aminopeptidase P family protein [Planctomycetaceae bacterium]
MHDRFLTRLNKLRRSLKKSGADSMLVTNFTNVTYLTGFTGDDSYLLITQQDAWLLSDSRYTTQLEEECPGLAVISRSTGISLLQLVAKLAKKQRLSNLAIEADTLTLGIYTRLRDQLATTQLCNTSGLVEALREIKDRHEILEIRDSVRLAQKTFSVIRAGLQGSQTEKWIAAEIEHQIRLFGGTGCSFAPIVAVGPRAALPHAVPTDQRIEEADFVLIDWGAQATLYASDLTRILVTGRISPKLERIYGVVLKAQQKAINAIRPGALMSDVDAAARDVITKAGFGPKFGHGLGHGIGLEIHEAPRLAINQEQPLKAGMVITIEPGIYLPGWGGVRIEDDILVTRDGHEVLSDVPKDLDSCIVD